MRRDSTIARLYKADKQKVVLKEQNSRVTTIWFIDDKKWLRFGLGQLLEQLWERGLYPSERAIELAILAATVTAADTRISRRLVSQDSWTREIDLYIPVKNAALWSAKASLIERILSFLTGDRWHVFFRASKGELENLIDKSTGAIGSQFSSVCLFSGGLDSFVGAIDFLEAGQNPLFVSHYWDMSTSSQIPCARLIETVYGDFHPRYLRARVGFQDDLVHASEPEKSTRGRSFLFFSSLQWQQAHCRDLPLFTFQRTA